jgi:hypothetical protein
MRREFVVGLTAGQYTRLPPAITLTWNRRTGVGEQASADGNGRCAPRDRAGVG